MKRTSAVLLILAACGGSPAETEPTEPTFSIRLEPAVLDLRVTETGSVKVIVSRSGGFAGAVAVTLAGESAGLEASPLSIGGDEGTLEIRVGASARIGTRFPVVQATSGAVTRSETLTLRVGGAVGGASSVTVENDAGSSQVRQGIGEVTLLVEGNNLERVTAVRLGDLEVSVLPGRTANRLELQARVPHGAGAGPKDLVLTADGGDSVLPAALTVTPVTSGPAGDDGTGAGTADKPYRSLTKALSVAQAGDTVRLLNGSYGVASVESWPSTGAGANVPAGVTVEGESTAGAVLEGPGSFFNVVGLAFGGDGGARSLTVRGFTYGFAVSAGAVALENTVAEGNGAGLGATGGTTKASGAEFRAGGRFGMYVSGSAAVELSGGSVHDNPEHGILIADGASLTATDLGVFGNSTGLTAVGQPELRLERVEIHDNRDHGLSVGGQARLRLAGSALYGNGQAGLSFGGRSLVVRGSIFRNNGSVGLHVVGSPEDVDLGNFTEPGNNELRDNGSVGVGGSAAVQIVDQRAGRATLGDPETFTMSGTLIDGSAPAAGIHPADGRWPHRLPPYLVISEVNNFVRVY